MKKPNFSLKIGTTKHNIDMFVYFSSEEEMKSYIEKETKYTSKELSEFYKAISKEERETTRAAVMLKRQQFARSMGYEPAKFNIGIWTFVGNKDGDKELA